jgi:hypothetical protein
MPASTDTVTIVGFPPRKEAGWCETQGVEHAWVIQNYVLTTDPPQSVRICANCGKEQTRPNTVAQPEWR